MYRIPTYSFSHRILPIYILVPIGIDGRGVGGKTIPGNNGNIGREKRFIVTYILREENWWGWMWRNCFERWQLSQCDIHWINRLFTYFHLSFLGILDAVLPRKNCLWIFVWMIDNAQEVPSYIQCSSQKVRKPSPDKIVNWANLIRLGIPSKLNQLRW